MRNIVELNNQELKNVSGGGIVITVLAAASAYYIGYTIGSYMPTVVDFIKTKIDENRIHNERFTECMDSRTLQSNTGHGYHWSTNNRNCNEYALKPGKFKIVE